MRNNRTNNKEGTKRKENKSKNESAKFQKNNKHTLHFDLNDMIVRTCI